ncbi:MAG: hypothetical protein RR996_06915 [Alistipes sp.]
MKTVVLFPTIDEGKAFIFGKAPVPVFISGVGSAETAAAIARAVKAKKPDLIVLAGIAGAYDRTLAIGSVVEVTRERTASLPTKYAQTYIVDPVTDLDEVSANTVDRTGAEAEGAQIEEMEGATFFALCEALGVRACQIRAVSNYVGDPFETWDIPRATEQLTETLNQFFQHNDKE